MSRIGKMPVVIPSGVEVKIDGTTVTVKGKKGELTRTFQPTMIIKQEGEELLITPADEERQTNAYWGLTRSLLHNMVGGVSEGFSHPVLVKAPEGITFEVPSQNEIIVSGASKEQVGQVAADIRKWRKPEPYKGKGIRYEGEHVRRKVGKAGKE